MFVRMIKFLSLGGNNSIFSIKETQSVKLTLKNTAEEAKTPAPFYRLFFSLLFKTIVYTRQYCSLARGHAIVFYCFIFKLFFFLFKKIKLHIHILGCQWNFIGKFISLAVAAAYLKHTFAARINISVKKKPFKIN